MSIIAEFDIVSPIMQETAQAVPNMVFRTEDLSLSSERKGRFVFWASGGNFTQMESALGTDSTVEKYQLLTKFANRRLYRVTFTDEGMLSMTYPAATEYDIQFLEVSATNERSQVRARVPTREALISYKGACEDRNIQFRLQRLYQETSSRPAQKYGLTKRQYESLAHAHGQGYFNVPRQVTLQELAEDFSVTPSALGRRLRRGQDALFQTVFGKSR